MVKKLIAVILILILLTLSFINCRSYTRPENKQRIDYPFK